ncbi:hypothetical protein [Actinomadura sp. NPDC000600]|uniref:LppU/SCO3897 family protein n=1 Tax=Actinomadura sp. NPDC000600 TaxID=3154262 RepID=UPI0033957CE0
MEPQRLRTDLPDPSPGLSRQTKFWLVFTSVFMVAVLVGAPVIAHLVGDGLPRKGECLEAKARGGLIVNVDDFRVVPCTAPTAAYQVVTVREGDCKGDAYGEASTSKRRGSDDLCLMLNAKVGDCFYQDAGLPHGKAAKVACGPSATYRVAAVVPGRTDPALCGRDVNPLEVDPGRPFALAYPEPPVTMCTVGV